MNIREQYMRDGFVHIKNAIQPVGTKWTNQSLKAILDKNPAKYIGTLRSFSKNATLQRILLSVDLHSLLGFPSIGIIEQPVVHVMSPDLKVFGGYSGTVAHQDWPSIQGSLDMVILWIPLTKCSVGNYPLEVIPQSHLQGLLPGKVNGSVLEVEANDSDFIPVECDIGDIILMSGFTVHRTGAGNGFRVAVSQRFDNTAEPTFIERGFPCVQRRVVDRSVQWKPTVEQVRNAFHVD